MQRYIVRCDKSMEKPLDFNSNKIEGYNYIRPEYNIFNALMEEFFKYKDVLGYNSVLCIIAEEYKNISPVIEKDKCNPSSYKFNRFTRHPAIMNYMNNNKLYDNETIVEIVNEEYEYIPKEVLLIDKNNTIRHIEISNNKLLRSLFHESIQYKDLWFTNIGSLIFQMDVSYNANENSCYYYGQIPIEYLSLISKNTPHVECYTTKSQFERHVKHIYNFINDNLDEIKKDLGITISSRIVPEFKYISKKDLLQIEKEKRRAQLLAELKKLDEE